MRLQLYFASGDSILRTDPISFSHRRKVTTQKSSFLVVFQPSLSFLCFRPKEYAQWSNGAWAGNTDHLYRKKRGETIKQEKRAGIFLANHRKTKTYLSPKLCQQRKEVKLYQDHPGPLISLLMYVESKGQCCRFFPHRFPPGTHRVPKIPTRSHRVPKVPTRPLLSLSCPPVLSHTARAFSTRCNFQCREKNCGKVVSSKH